MSILPYLTGYSKYHIYSKRFETRKEKSGDCSPPQPLEDPHAGEGRGTDTAAAGQNRQLFFDQTLDADREHFFLLRLQKRQTHQRNFSQIGHIMCIPKIRLFVERFKWFNWFGLCGHISSFLPRSSYAQIQYTDLVA